MENSTDVPINSGWVFVKFLEGPLVHQGIYDPIVFVEQPPAVLMCLKLHRFLLMLVCAGGLLQIKLILGVLIFINSHGFRRISNLQSLAVWGIFPYTSQ